MHVHVHMTLVCGVSRGSCGLWTVLACPHLTCQSRCSVSFVHSSTQLACLPARFLSHDVCIWSIEAQSSSWQAVCDKVHPQQLYRVQCLWHAQQGCKEDGNHFTNVGRHHVADELHPQPEVSLQIFMIRNSVPGANESGLTNKGGLKTATIPLLFHHAVSVTAPTNRGYESHTHDRNDRCPEDSGYSMSNRAGQRKDCNHTTVHY